MINRRTLLAAAASVPTLALSQSGKEKLKYLQIGIGHPHANKFEVYQASGDWEVVGLVEEDPELQKKAKASELYSDVPLMTLEEGLNVKGLAAVGVETEIRDLLSYAEKAIDAGVSIHLDKPAGDSFEHYQRIMKKADDAGLIVQMGYMYRFNPAIRLLHRMLDAGWLGEVFETHAVMSKVMSPESRAVIDEFSGGTMFELGCHIIDLTVGVLGKPDRIVPYSKRVLDSAEDSLQDNMLAVFEYTKATATVRSTAVEVDGFSRRHFAVCGTEGTCHIQPLDRPSMTLSLSKERKFSGEETVYKKGRQEIKFEPPYQRYVGDAADFAATIRGEKENSYPSSHDLAVQDTVLKASEM
ncbi:MAG: Gfo/Idh/MocA family oxidoreductase [Verrucomicrobiales bacterium]|nr:Gfo/Idh/MocA family oxidoreductase [Verrucomicrobiales bacterium]